jgi:hypothetical protein
MRLSVADFEFLLREAERAIPTKEAEEAEGVESEPDELREVYGTTGLWLFDAWRAWEKLNPLFPMWEKALQTRPWLFQSPLIGFGE